MKRLTAVLAALALVAPAQVRAQGEPESPAGEEEAEEAEASEKPEAPADEEEAMEEDLDELLEDPGSDRPPAAGKGLIRGTVRDDIGEPVIEALVRVLGTKIETVTDLDGQFRLELPPGTYSVRIFYELYKPVRLEQLTVIVGKATKADVQLELSTDAVDEVLVEEELERSSVEGQIMERKRSVSIGDGVARTEISRTPDRNAAEASQRIVGVTIVDGRFVYVRGLGERYTNALLNGAPLPSPEPDRQTVPLDMFPTQVLEGITIKKQFMPDMPADFAGGSVLIQTRDFPRKQLFEVTLSTAYDTSTTLEERPGQRRSGTDWLGFDSGYRQLPDEIPDRKLEGASATDEELFTWGRRINSYMSPTSPISPPNYGGNVVAGNQFDLGGQRKLGVIAALTYSRSWKKRQFTRKNYAPELGGGEPGARVIDEIHGVTGVETARWGAFANGSLEISPAHRLSLSALHSQHGDALATNQEGFFESSLSTLRSTHLEYVSRSLDFIQLRGRHKPADFHGGETEWHAAWSLAKRDQPDTRDIIYSRVGPSGGGPLYEWSSGPQSGSHFYSEQDERSLIAGLDHTQPLGVAQKTKLKLGGLVTGRSRDFSARRFVLEPERRPSDFFLGFTRCHGPDGEWVDACPDALFSQANIGPGGLTLRESTLRYDEYAATLDVYAGYGMLDFEIVPELQVAGGVRVEITDQRFAAWDPYQRETTTTAASINSTDVLPAVSVVYRVNRASNTRFGVSRTLARPQLRETSPFLATPAVGEMPVQGNPDLTLTKIVNADLRFETFPTLREVLAFSFFYKRFKDPIEEVIVPGTQSGIINYANAPSAEVMGIELEGRKNLGVFAPELDDFTLIGNVTVAHSRVDLGDQIGVATNPDRPMSYQSPYVINFSADYANETLGSDVRVLYRIQGPRITAVGSDGLPDIYEQPRHVVELTAAQRIVKPLEVKLTITNLLGAPVVYAHRGAREYVRVPLPGGASALQATGSDPETLRYEPGRLITLSGTYTY